MGKDYYDILGLSKNASEEEIKKAYRKKALQFHPDKSKDENSEEKFKEVGEAYEILSDSEKKSAYDRHRSRNAQFHAYTFRATRDPFDLFQTFFGGKDPFSDIFASVFAQHGEFCQHPSQNSKFVSKHFLKVRSRGASESADPSAKTTVEVKTILAPIGAQYVTLSACPSVCKICFLFKITAYSMIDSSSFRGFHV